MHIPKIVSSNSGLLHVIPWSMLLLITSLLWIAGGSTLAEAPQRTPTFIPYSGTASTEQLAAIDQLTQAMDIPASLIVSATLNGSDPVGENVFTSPLGGFPTKGTTFAAISSGNAAQASLPNTSGSLSTILAGLNNAQGNDMFQLDITLNVPPGAKFWAVDWKFLSEEYPEFVGSSFNDAYFIETPTSSITISGNVASSVNNVAFDPSGNPVTINTTGAVGMTAANASGTTYDGGTVTLTTVRPIAPGATTLRIIFSVTDLGDSIYDTTVFLDNFRFVSEIELVGLEVNQAVQDWNDSVQLIQDKPTIVRAHIQPKGPNPVVAEAKLRAFRGGVELPSSPLTAINPGGTITAQSNSIDRRGNLDGSLNFRLPLSWLHGTVDLRLEGVSTALECKEAAGTANDCSVQVMFESTDDPEVKFVGVTWVDSTGARHGPNTDSTELARRLVAIYPISNLDWSTGERDYLTQCANGTDDDGDGAVNDGCPVVGTAETGVQCANGTDDDGDGAVNDGCPVVGTAETNSPTANDLVTLNLDLASQRFWDFCWQSLNCKRLYFGFLGGAPEAGGLARGIPGEVGAQCANSGDDDGDGVINGGCLAVGAGEVNAECSNGIDDDGDGVINDGCSVAAGRNPAVVACGDMGIERNVHAHEIAHILGERHAPFCMPLQNQDPNAPLFPYSTTIGGRTVATLGPMDQGEDSKIFGLDTHRMIALSPTENFELMSYCFGGNSLAPAVASLWTSHFTYDRLRSVINNSFSGPLTQPVAGPEQNYLVVRGIVNFNSDTAKFVPFGTISSPAQPPMPLPGDYRLELRDASGNLIQSVSFEPSADHGLGTSDLEIGSFIIPVLANSDIRQALVFHGSISLTEQSASGNPPIVQVIFPNGGESLGGAEASLQWTGDDPDGDLLSYLVQYSRDGGSTWETLITDWPHESLEVPRNLLAETSNGVIRVMASDGFNATTDDSDGAFSVPNNPPEASISSPGNNEVFVGTQSIFFVGLATDREDAQLSGASLVWTSDRDGFLGIGKNLDLEATALSEGSHVITLTATDSGGLTDVKSVNVTVLGSPSPSISPPVFDVPPTPSPGTEFNINTGQPLAVNIQASDPDSLDTVNLGVIDSPAGASFTVTPGNPATGILAWTPSGIQSGVHIITFTATDNHGVAGAPVQIVVTVLSSNHLPIADAGSDQTIECQGNAEAMATLDASGSFDEDSTPGTNDDIVSFTWTEDSSPLASGESVSVPLQLGFHNVTLTVMDMAGATGTDDAIITVWDKTPPFITCPESVTVECQSAGWAQIPLPLSTASDLCYGSATIVNDRTAGGPNASGSYPLGTTVVTFTATDGSGNSSTCTTQVTVVDTTPPILTLAADPTQLWPPNHRMVPVTASWQVADACDPAPAVVLFSALSSEPEDAEGDGDGNTTGDIADADLGTPDSEVSLRAERAGDGPGRIYQLVYRAMDGSGNSTSALAVVTVPHDQGSGPDPLKIALEPEGTATGVHIYWGVVPDAGGYDLVFGDIANIASDGQRISLGPVRVLARGMSGTSFTEEAGGPAPDLDRAFFYVIQYRDGQRPSGYGTASATLPREPAICEGGCP